MIPTCKDLDATACVLLHKQKPDLCTDAIFSNTACMRFCGKCRKSSYFISTCIWNPYPGICFCPENVFCFLSSAALSYIHFRLHVIIEAITMDPDQTALFEQSDMGPYEPRHKISNNVAFQA